MRQHHELVVKFSVSGIPDSAGLRIKTTEPTGLYISSRDPAAAQWYLETMIIHLIIKRGLLKPTPGGGWSLVKKLDWPDITGAGYGEAIVCTVGRAEVQNMQRKGSPVLIPPVQKLTIDWWNNPKRELLCIVRDEGDMIDGWVVSAITDDLKGKTVN